MSKHITKKRVLATLSIAAISTLLVQAYVFAQPTTPPPGGNINARFNSIYNSSTIDQRGAIYNSNMISPNPQHVMIDDDLEITGTADIQGQISNSTGSVSINDALFVNGLLSVPGKIQQGFELNGVKYPVEIIGGMITDANVGIGTSTPSENLVVGDDLGEVYYDSAGLVVGDSSAAAHVTVGEDSLNNGSMFWFPSVGGLELRTRSGGTENSSQLFLAGDGKIGMGTIYPFAKLQIGTPTSVDTTFHTAHPNGLALAANATNTEPAIWMGKSDSVNTQIVYDGTNGNLSFETKNTFTNPYHLVLDGNGNVGINAGTDIDNQTLLVKKGADYVYEVIRGQYDDNNYGYLGGAAVGAGATGTTHGIFVSAQPESGSSNNAYGIESVVARNGTGTYYSGYFREAGYPTNPIGPYLGLWADVRSGDSIDIAEYILDTANNTEPGDTVIADPNNKESIIKSNTPYDTSVIGVISTKPHLTMGMELIKDPETGELLENVNAAKLTLAGRIPIKVTNENGQIKPGDLLTTSSTPGYAMKWTPLASSQATNFEELKAIMDENTRRQNAIIGKALESLDTEEGTIVGLLSL